MFVKKEDCDECPNDSVYCRECNAGTARARNSGRKDDAGKTQMNLLDDMPYAIHAVVKVMEWAIKEKKPIPYKAGSWLEVHPDRYRAAIARHNRDACTQAINGDHPARMQFDDETNMLHLAHIACSALMALENTIREMRGDQSYE